MMERKRFIALFLDRCLPAFLEKQFYKNEGDGDFQKVKKSRCIMKPLIPECTVLAIFKKG